MDKMRRYKDDYEMRETRDRNGKVRREPVYVGPWFIRTADDEMNKRLKRLYTAGAVLILICFVVCGYVNHVGNRNMIVTLSYAVSVFPLVYNFLGMVEVLKAGEKITRRENDMSVGRMKRSCIFISVLYAAALVTEAVLLFITEESIRPGAEIAFMLCSAVIIVTSRFISYLCKKYPYKEEMKEKESSSMDE